MSYEEYLDLLAVEGTLVSSNDELTDDELFKKWDVELIAGESYSPVAEFALRDISLVTQEALSRIDLTNYLTVALESEAETTVSIKQKSDSIFKKLMSFVKKILNDLIRKADQILMSDAAKEVDKRFKLYKEDYDPKEVDAWNKLSPFKKNLVGKLHEQAEEAIQILTGDIIEGKITFEDAREVGARKNKELAEAYYKTMKLEIPKVVDEFVHM